MVIHVSQSCIDRGCKGDGQACPVALAITEATGYDCLVETGRIMLYVNGKAVITNSSTRIDLFIDGFDGDYASKWVAPFTFELDIEGVG